MDNHLFGLICATLLFWYIFGWKGLLVAFLFILGAWYESRQPRKKPGPLTAAIMKLGDNSDDDK
ncbi:MAG: hypothetical protein IJS01_09665 [Lentisphaeria bacterium]|nr:hypothetical protein [Lentisphaeria bacterium]